MLQIQRGYYRDVMEGSHLAGTQGVASDGRGLCPNPSRPGAGLSVPPKLYGSDPELEKSIETLNKIIATHTRACHTEPGNPIK